VARGDRLGIISATDEHWLEVLCPGAPLSARSRDFARTSQTWTAYLKYARYVSTNMDTAVSC
jgi:hypothetical protein